MNSHDFSASDAGFMTRALELAQSAAELGEVPVGAVIVREGRIVAEGFNLREALNDPTAHAERLSLTMAGRALGSWRLDECTLYVTLEPCPMCAGALVLARLPRVVYGARDPKAGACESLFRLLDDPRLNHRVKVEGGLMAEPCGSILSHFFRERRRIVATRNATEGCLSG